MKWGEDGGEEKGQHRFIPRDLKIRKGDLQISGPHGTERVGILSKCYTD